MSLAGVGYSRWQIWETAGCARELGVVAHDVVLWDDRKHIREPDTRVPNTCDHWVSSHPSSVTCVEGVWPS